MTAIEIYSEQIDVLGEGPLWSVSEQTLYWLDIARKTLLRKRASDATCQQRSLPDYPGCLAELSPGSIAIAMGAGIQRLTFETGEIDLLYLGPARRSGTRFNDGKVDPRGRFWVGTMQNNLRPDGESCAVDRQDGALYCFESDGNVITIEENIGIANTLAWSPDLKRFYFGDSLRGQIFRYDFDADTGIVGNKREFFAAAERGVPDGSAIDVDGCLWNARWDGGAILRITPEGQLDRVIELPVPRPTSCIFGGPNFETLYVTSATCGLSAEQLEAFPLSGSVFAIEGVGQGMPVPPIVCNVHSKEDDT